jgi:hypothetical protein
MKRRVNALVWAWILSAVTLLLVCSPAAVHASQTAVVNNPNPQDRLHLRVLPSASSASLGKYYNGVEVLVLLDDGTSWLRVRVGDTVGYMARTYLRVGASNPLGGAGYIWTRLKQGANGRAVNVRGQANSTARILYTGYDDAVIALGIAGDWYHIALNGNGRTIYGYVRGSDLEPFSAPSGSAGGSSGGSSGGSPGGAVPNTVPNFPARKVGSAASPDRSEPVYSAPSMYSVRGAGGKASVGLNAVFYTYGMVYNASERASYMLVRYSLASGGARFGYINANAVYDAKPAWASFSNISATVTRNVSVTDDPVKTHAALVSLAGGTRVTVLAKYTDGGTAWAYIEGTRGSQVFRGFVPYSGLAFGQ